MNKWLTPHLNNERQNSGSRHSLSVGLILILFLASMILDGIIFPALFGFGESFLTIIFLIGILLYYRDNLHGLVLGAIISGLAEFYWGLKPGTLVLSLLASAGVFFLLNSFFNVRSRIFILIVGVIMFIVFWEASILIDRIV